MGYEISTCQMQYDAADKKTDQEDPCLYTLEGTDLENVESIKYLGVTITNDLRWNTHVSALRLTGPETKLTRKKKQLIKDWCARSWSMAVRFGTPQV